MKSLPKILLGSFLLGQVLFTLSGCVADGYVGVNEGVYYGPHRDPWFHDDDWVDGHGWYGDEPRGGASVGIYLHPPRRRW